MQVLLLPIALFQGPAQLSIVCCSTEKRGEPGIFSLVSINFYPDVTHVRKDTRPSPTIPSLAGPITRRINAFKFITCPS